MALSNINVSSEVGSSVARKSTVCGGVLLLEPGERFVYRGSIQDPNAFGGADCTFVRLRNFFEAGEGCWVRAYRLPASVPP